MNSIEYKVLNDSIYSNDNDYLDCYKSHQQFNRNISLIIKENPKPSTIRITEKYIKTLQQKAEIESTLLQKKSYSKSYYQNNKQRYKSYKGDPSLYKKRGRPCVVRV